MRLPLSCLLRASDFTARAPAAFFFFFFFAPSKFKRRRIRFIDQDRFGFFPLKTHLISWLHTRQTASCRWASSFTMAAHFPAARGRTWATSKSESPRMQMKAAWITRDSILSLVLSTRLQYIGRRLVDKFQKMTRQTVIEDEKWKKFYRLDLLFLFPSVRHGKTQKLCGCCDKGPHPRAKIGHFLSLSKLSSM